MTINLGTSLPSIPITLVDVPEAKNFNCKFIYSFFAKDELTEEAGAWTDNLGVKHTAKPGFEPSSLEYVRNSPRYVHLTWEKVNVSSNQKTIQEFVDISIQENSNFILDEDQADIKSYDTFEQQEINFVKQTQFLLDKLYRNLNYNRVNASLNDAARAIHETTPEAVSQEFINKYLNYSYSDNLSFDANAKDPALEMSKINTAFSTRNKVFGNLLHEKIMNDSLTSLNSSFIEALQNKFNNQFIVKQFENRFNGSEYDLYLENPIEITAAENVSDFGSVFQSTGYIIERYKVQSNGQLTDKRTFYIENPEITEYFDTFIAYNQTYIYNIRAIAVLKTLGYNSDEKVNVITTFLVSSKRVKQQVICVDKKQTEPPTDFFIRWDYGLKKPVLTWNFPIDSRRHIKYFQVFRRQNRILNGRDIRPAQQPFELIRMYDFNDLQNASGVFYTISNGSYQFLNGDDSIDINIVMNPTTTKDTNVFTSTSFIDEEFNKENYYIYTVVAVDAHGISSNYSNQIGIRWNKLRNTIERFNISSPNAPKPYPNFFIEKDAFVDTIKNEGYNQVTVAFNPEYYELYRESGEDLKLLKYGPDNFYRLQLINTDLQEDQFVDIKIFDERNNNS